MPALRVIILSVLLALNSSAQPQSGFHLEAGRYPGRSSSRNPAWEMVVDDMGTVHQYLLTPGGNQRCGDGTFQKREEVATLQLDQSQLQSLQDAVADSGFFKLKSPPPLVWDCEAWILNVSNGSLRNKFRSDSANSTGRPSPGRVAFRRVWTRLLELAPPPVQRPL